MKLINLTCVCLFQFYACFSELLMDFLIASIYHSRASTVGCVRGESAQSSIYIGCESACSRLEWNEFTFELIKIKISLKLYIIFIFF